MGGTTNLRRTRSWWLWRAVAIVATFGILAAACGDDDEDAAPAETAEAAPEAAPEPEPAEEPEAAPEPEPAEEPEAAPEPEPAEEPEAAPEPEPAEEPEVVGGEVKVGMITTLSTGAAYLGEGIRDAFILAFELDGRYELDLIVEDDGRDPAFAQQLADRMLTRDEVDVMTGIVFSNVAGAVVPQVVNAGTIYISPNAAPSPFAGAQCHENYFVASWQNDNQSEAMGVYVASQGYDSVIALAPNYQAGHDLVAGFKRFFGEVDEEIYTELGATDYAQAIAQIREANPEAVYFFYPGGMGIAFVQQYIASGLEIPIFGPMSSFDEVIVDAIGDVSLGLFNSSFWAPDMDNEANRVFVEAYREKYGTTPTAYAAQGYDAALLLISALDANGGSASDTAGMREALKAADFDSVRGKFRFNTNNHPIQDWYLLEVIRDPVHGDLTNTIVATILEDHEDAYASDCPLTG